MSRNILILVCSFSLVICSILFAKPNALEHHHDVLYNRADGFIVDTSIVYTAPEGHQKAPALAFDGENYMVVYEDQRDSYIELVAARIATEGQLVDTAVITVCTNIPWTPNHVMSDIAYDGTNYLVVWADPRSGEYNIYGRRISPSGVLIDTDPIIITNENHDHRKCALAFDGVNYLVVWEENQTGNNDDIHGARVSTSGVVLDTTSIVITAMSYFERSPDISFDGMNYFVVWSGGWTYEEDVWGTRITPAGIVLDTVPIVVSMVSGQQTNPSVHFGDRSYVVTWQDSRNAHREIYAARVSPAGTVLDTTGINMAEDYLAINMPDVHYDGTNFMVIWDASVGNFRTDIFGARLSPSGVVLDTVPIQIHSSPYYNQQQVIAFDGINYLVVWDNIPAPHSSSERNLFGARLSPFGYVIDTSGILLSVSANEQGHSSIATDGENYFIVWEDYHKWPGSLAIYGMRINEYGTIIDPLPISLTSDTFYNMNPSCAYGDSVWCIVWHQRGSQDKQIGKLVWESGNGVIDTLGFTVTESASTTSDVCFDGANFFVVWEDRRNVVTDSDIYGARISTQGVVIDTAGIPICSEIGWQVNPAVVFDGVNYMVVWTDCRDTLYYDWFSIYGARVTPSGVVIDTFGIAISDTTIHGFAQCPDVAFDGTNHMVVWSDFADIFGARVSQSGVVIDTNAIEITHELNQQRNPAVAFNGTNYIVAWEDRRNDVDYDIYGAEISPDAVVLHESPIIIAARSDRHPAIDVGNNGQVFVTYSGWTDSINSHVARARRIWGVLDPFVTINEDNDYDYSRSGCGLFIYPNPAYKTCNISYSLTQSCFVSVHVYDVAGRRVKTCINEKKKKGFHTTCFDMVDFPQGIYFIYLQAMDHTVTQKVILIK